MGRGPFFGPPSRIRLEKMGYLLGTSDKIVAEFRLCVVRLFSYGISLAKSIEEFH